MKFGGVSHWLYECFQCYVIIDCCLTLKSCTFQPMVTLINDVLTYLLTYFMGDRHPMARF